MGRKRSCDNNKAIQMVKKALPKLKKEYSGIGRLDLVFKKGKRTGSHCYCLEIQTMMGSKKFTVIKSKKSVNSNFQVLKKAEQFLSDSLNYEIAYYLHS